MLHVESLIITTKKLDSALVTKKLALMCVIIGILKGNTKNKETTLQMIDM
jgi:hypothetical protein